MVYDNADRLRLFQDGNQRERNVWTYIKYDALEREILRGEFNSASTRAYIQDRLSNTDTTLYETYSYSMTDFYTNNSYPTTSYKTLSAKYYDDYEFYTKTASSLPFYFRSQMGTLSSIISDPLKTRGLLTCSKEATVGTTSTSYRWSAYFYDGLHDIPYKTLTSNTFSRIDLEELNMNYTGQVLSKTILHAALDAYVTEYFNYTYDHAGRLKETRHHLKSGLL